MLSESFTKTKLKDPLILDLLQNIRDRRSMLENLEIIKVNPNFTNIFSNEVGRELYIENEFHRAKGFRKLHIEVAEFSMKLKILHCVFFPDPMFDIPIFGMDLVKINDIVSAAIVDLSPASHNQDFKYEKSLSEVDKSSFSSLREIPKWGEIFSKNVLFASLKSNSEKNDFCRVVDQYLNVLIKLSYEAKPEFKEEIIQERIDYQKNYCVQQMKNEKTSMVLLKYFDEKWVNKYIKTVLFDF
ncbi:phycocyanobilin:ferredoxin oxidoreductase [Prochlorococcus marinus]|uniref:phycocyanobilin:ferredoxin oxidoreductase n=1 Tax=Prochlorococcus marinus TaxID=1219 RepID=UPI001AD97F18|nr:phycocyanobilin:ferredoxin oxidoreductase [Prochlorococcus marinus]MBO8217079.1 phycocyanobilin:ferredoxin oxidoreductase [Prochlorococcus marinus XMU1405]MBW3040306.1 phycocyanobilin:ferredoxin oxidoreductase [Prochlorococcus marinus str. MU1405]MBW3047764.1 phycocyanobilin:ferredoxin oxidoreductase [Prochlorococcus marinus str. MU1406]